MHPCCRACIAPAPLPVARGIKYSVAKLHLFILLPPVLITLYAQHRLVVGVSYSTSSPRTCMQWEYALHTLLAWRLAMEDSSYALHNLASNLRMGPKPPNFQADVEAQMAPTCASSQRFQCSNVHPFMLLG